MLRVCYFLNCMGQTVPSFRPNMGKNSVLQPSCQWFLVHCKVRMYFDIFNRLGVPHECDGQTDGQTDKMALSNSAL